MKKARRKIPSVIALSLVVATLMVMTSGIAAASGVSVLTATPAGQSIHGKINMSEITGEIAEPPQLTSAASAVAKEKQWYEYVYYSPEPVGQYYVSENTRISFYDPYDYADALIMEVDDTITDWSSMNSMQVSYTTGNSLTDTTGVSTDTSSSIEIADGADVSDTYTDESIVTTTVSGRVETYNKSKTDAAVDTNSSWSNTNSYSSDFTFLIEASIGADSTYVKDSDQWTESESSEYTDSGSTTVTGERTTTDRGWTEDNTTTTTKTDAGHSKVVSVVADRLTQATGTSKTASITLSTDNSTTITKTYDAAYFNASGSPLQWKIIQYTVKMPMKYQVEYLVDGEWIFGEYNYCLLTTIQGTCRAWLQNSVAYYEHWGDGSPVTWNEFWSQFFTEESLIQTYQNRLYPEY